MTTHIDIKIYGSVQGVGFRYSAKIEAGKLGIKGFARNEADGSVYIEAEGNKKDLERFLEWCRRGPDFAAVSRVDFKFSDALKRFTDFAIV